MVDIVSAEARRKELLDESLGCVYPEDAFGIRQRYKDTALILFKEQLSDQHADNKSFLSFGTRRASTVSEYGNTPIIVRKSRSANGELSKVAEQWPSLRGRPSISNYTLHEAREKENEEKEEEEDTEAEEELEEEQCESKKIITRDEQAVCKDEQVVCKEHFSKDFGDEKYGVTGNRKSFSHYDINLHRRREFFDKEAKDDEDEEGETIDREIEEDNKDAESMRTVLEVEGVDHRIVLVKSTTNKKDPSSFSVNTDQVGSVCRNPQDDVSEISLKEDVNEITLKEDVNEISLKEDGMDNKIDEAPLESHYQDATNMPQSLNVDHDVVISNYVQNYSFVNNIHNDKSETRSDFDISGQRSSDDWRRIELRIIEPTDCSVPVDVTTESFNFATESNSNLTSKLLRGGVGDDNDDVVFIDDFSPSAGEQERILETGTNFNQKVSQVHGSTTPIPTKPGTKPPSVPTSPKPPSVPSSPLLASSQASEKCVRNDSIDEIDNSMEAENQNGLLALPIRSPTPPKRSPRRSPRVPKSKDRSHERHSSLDLPADLDQQPSTSKPIMSASPSKSKDSSRIFNFSLKKERSKSASSLISKKNKDKEKVVRSESEDPGVVNPSVVSDIKFENSGKRVGVRSMVIDGTIKRNFIVIHPSDDSETIGLAPLSSFANGDRTSVKTSRALSSVKSHITGTSSTRMESLKRISSKQELKEEVLNASKDFRDRESLNVEMGSEKSRVRVSSKKQSESRVHGSSVSLSSNVSHVNSKVLLGSSGGLSEVDCSVVNVSTQGITLSSTKTTSRLCVVM